MIRKNLYLKNTKDDEEHLVRTVKKMAGRSDEELVETIIRANRMDAVLVMEMKFNPIREQDLGIMKRELIKRLEWRKK